MFAKRTMHQLNNRIFHAVKNQSAVNTRIREMGFAPDYEESPVDYDIWAQQCNELCDTANYFMQLEVKYRSEQTRLLNTPWYRKIFIA